MVVVIRNKRKIIRKKNILTHTDTSFFARYKDHEISIEKQKKGWSKWYAIVTTPDGGYIVDGYFDYDTMYGVLEMCFENIFYDQL